MTDAVGLASASCAVAAALLSLPGIARLSRKAPLPTLVAALAVAAVPWGPLPVAGYLRGMVGDLSVTTLLLLLVRLLRPVLPLPSVSDRSRLALQFLVVAGALLLYPLTLGLGPADPYRLGFAHVGFVSTLLLLSLAAWCARLHWVALCVATGVAAWAAGALESRNLWDYLLDPLLAIWATGALGRRLARRRHGRLSSDTL